MASDQLPLPTTTTTSDEDTPTPTATAAELPPTATTEAGEGEAQPETVLDKVEAQKEDDVPEESTLPRQSLDVEGSDLEEEMNQVSLEGG